MNKRRLPEPRIIIIQQGGFISGRRLSGYEEYQRSSQFRDFMVSFIDERYNFELAFQPSKLKTYSFMELEIVLWNLK